MTIRTQKPNLDAFVSGAPLKPTGPQPLEAALPAAPEVPPEGSPEAPPETKPERRPASRVQSKAPVTFTRPKALYAPVHAKPYKTFPLTLLIDDHARWVEAARRAGGPGGLEGFIKEAVEMRIELLNEPGEGSGTM